MPDPRQLERTDTTLQVDKTPAPDVIVPPVDQWQQKTGFTILDTSFGAGNQFLATWQAWRDDAQRPQRLHYLGLLPNPASLTELVDQHVAWPKWATLAQELRAVWPTLVPGFHRLYLAQNSIILTLMIGDSDQCLRQITARIESFFIHGEGPRTWPPALFARLNRLAAPQAKLTIVDLNAGKQSVLEQAGFVFEKTASAENINDSADFTTAGIACFSPRWQTNFPHAHAIPSRSHAIVIGAGLAGAAACQRLTLRGWKVTLIERHAQIAQEASGNAAGIFMPVLSRDDNPTSRLTRAAYLFAHHVWQGLGGIGNAFSGARCGVLQVARDAVHEESQQRWAQQANLPPDFAQWLTQPDTSALVGTAVSHGGWWFSGGGWIHPLSLCEAMLKACGDRLQTHFGVAIHELVKTSNGWQVSDNKGKVIASAPIVILANGMEALNLCHASALPLTAIRGQVTYVAAESAPKITPVLCGDGYLTPESNGMHSLGASYDEDNGASLRQKSQNENLARIKKILPSWDVDPDNLPLAGRVGFRCVAPDRLPLIGALPDPMAKSQLREPQLKDMPRLSGLYGLLGFASRGLIWAPLAAELLAAELNNEPMPVEAELAAALDPARFLLKAQRRNQSK
ncbi:FAD-dependent 5-carboxymethylaminomethyl-2-thiouridine(34) oxidoreductase MnmC [Glaciimonas sp. PAMC28666]|uniref:FAD-dependent 5-carboxymethylaminomethyl-2-thiouridine(34) oxidoreductase MnmC n=1 Tax=Glaciimonas sp. PAMC28666 TaxID=2807626 RepID=UPI001964621B|nr:FAD-dependent 5-carboxymethylaminomethyl-2-thiouridine(34) oxidoreductase MnmC [Glaciimonas sp. PAMC28666]QRX83988.1 FAD-dependent 5-carboxymethylaminomethyl-2-thiouridine(34) oxidoreductase MnmC [Glaciimonas sp. PAMC28666]